MKSLILKDTSVDEHCDLTLDKLAEKMDKEHAKIDEGTLRLHMV